MNKYPSLERFSKSISIPRNDLVEAFEIEKEFHEKILNEEDKFERIRLYNQLYSIVHPIYKRNSTGTHNNGDIISRKAFLFKKELINKSVLEVGCGQGAFLKTLAKFNFCNRLCGLDVTIPDDETRSKFPQIEFVKADITEFKVSQKYDVIYSNHVLEHMVSSDLQTHLSSVFDALEEGGVFIINMPNSLFGPSDVTRIIDFSYTNKVKSLGSHFNELTYNELIPMLKTHGFKSFETVFPHIRLRHILRKFRMNPEILCKVERSRLLMNILHSIKYKGTCGAKFEITLICYKK